MKRIFQNCFLTSVRFLILTSVAFGSLQSSITVQAHLLPNGKDSESYQVDPLNPESPDAGRKIYIPSMVNLSDSLTSFPKMLGLYTNDWIGYNETIQKEMYDLDSWAGKGLSIGGTFVDFTSNPEWMIRDHLTFIWDHGYTPFVNLGTSKSTMTIRNIANGGADSYFVSIARNFKIFANNGQRMAFIAPLQEMNGDYVVYKSPNPSDYITAYRRLQGIFQQEGVPAKSVRWVFAPNGASSSGYPPFESYYPGSNYVDVIGFSAYNMGYCDWAPVSWRGWHLPPDAIGQYLQRAVALDTSKPVFVAQMATSSVQQNGQEDPAAKNQWLNDAYTYFLSYPTLKAIIYFNFYDPADGAQCDWAIFVPNGDHYTGYKQGITFSAYQRVAPTVLRDARMWDR